jgi:putative phosphoserine phosphatase/1-acylglycerol-3-phosphate O-acyltransferase
VRTTAIAPPLDIEARGQDRTSVRRRARLRAWTLAITGGLLVSAGALVMIPLGVVTLFRARRLYAGCARAISLAVLRLYGIRLVVHGRDRLPRTQTDFVSNHTSTLDVFLLVGLGLPNCRFFLSGFLRKFVPLGIISSMMGTFFTVPQNRPLERKQIFARAGRVLRRTRESVYLSPEGGRIRTGEIGPFNKGAFHLATDLGVPIVPLYIRIPASVDPGFGYDARPGTVDVFVLPAIDTAGWMLDNLNVNKERVRTVLIDAHRELRAS